MPADRRVPVRPHPGTREEAQVDRTFRRHDRNGRGGRRRRQYRPGGVALDRGAGRTHARRREGKTPAHGEKPRGSRHRPGRGGARGVDGGTPCPRRAAGPAPSDRLVHLPGPHRRRQDRADQGARRVPVRRRERDGPPRHVRIHGEAFGGPAAPGAARVYRPCARRREDMARIVDIQIKGIDKLLADRKIVIDLDAAAREWLADKGYDSAYGARPLRRVIQKTVQDPLAEMILSGRVKDGEKVTISATKFGLTFNGKVAAAAA